MRALTMAIVGLALSLSGAAGAQEVEIVPPSFQLDEGDPSPCFEFACYNGSDFDGDTLVAVGAVVPRIYVWVRDEMGSWTQQAALAHPDPAAPTIDHGFGSLLAIDGDDLVFSGGELGGLLVYHRSGATWSHRQTLPGSGYLDLERGTLVTTDDSGFVVYEKSAGGLFRKRAALKLPAFVDGYLSGPVEIDRNTAIIAGGDDTDGAVFVFQRFFGAWLFVQKLAAPPAAAEGGFGSALAIDGDRIAIAAPGTPGLDETRPGVVQTYVRRGLKWRTSELLQNPLPLDGYYRSFGTALDVEDRRLLVSAGRPSYPFASFIPSSYVYDASRNGWELSLILEAGAAQSVELSGSSALVDSILLRYGAAPSIFDLP